MSTSIVIYRRKQAPHACEPMMNGVRRLCSRVLGRVMIAAGMICGGPGEGGDPKHIVNDNMRRCLFILSASFNLTTRQGRRIEE